MTEKVHGYSKEAEAVTGNWDFFTVYTTHELGVTGVVQSLADFKASHGLASATNISTLSATKRTFLGTALADDAAYNDAYARQWNFDAVQRVIGQFAEPVLLGTPIREASTTNPTSAVVRDFDGTALVSAGDFGTDITASNALVSAVAFAIERADVFGTNNVLLENAFNGVSMRATAASGASGGPDEDISGATVAAGTGTLSAVSASGSNQATKQSVVVVKKTNVLPFGYMSA